MQPTTQPPQPPRDRPEAFPEAHLARNCYAAIALHLPGGKGTTLLSDGHGRVVVFDTPLMANWIAPTLSGGRQTTWDATGEVATFWPLEPGQVNRISIITDYDPYNLPAMFPVKSETKLMGWKHHIHWGAWRAGLRGERGVS